MVIINNLKLCANVLLVVLFCFSSTCYSNDYDINFTHYTTDNGLSSSEITSIIQDVDGCMWIGTMMGLNRFDGYTFKNFYHIEKDNSSLSNNSITCLFLDSKKRLWIGTQSGVNLYLPETETFKNQSQQGGKTSTLFNEYISCIFEDSKKRIWICTWEGLNLFDPEMDCIEKFKVTYCNDKKIFIVQL